jgi:tetratricopeptide (TPR) repeat protein
MTQDDRKLAIAFNQRTWALFDKKDRSAEEAEEMVTAAYASLAHWTKAGTAVNRQRGEWLIARVYAELGRAEPALHHLKRTLDLTAAHRGALKDFDLAFAAALAARVYALAGKPAQVRPHYEEATRLGEAIADPADRKMFFDQLAEGPWFGFTR